MDEVKLREKQFDTETINLSSSDFNVSNIKTLEETDLQDFLLGNISSEVEEVEKVPKKKEPEPNEETPPTPKKKKEVSPVKEEDVNDYLSKEQDDGNDQEDEPPVKDKKTTPEEDENLFTTLDRDLIKAGIFDEEEEDEIKDAASFKDKFIRQMNKGANSMLEQFLSQHSPEHRRAFDAIFVKGVDPRTYLSQFERIKDVESLDIKSTEVQEQVMRQYYRSQGLENEKIESKIQKLKDYGDLEEDAERIHSLMIKEEKRRLVEEEEAAEEEQIRIAELRKNYQLSLQKILTDKVKAKSFNGIPVDNNTANKIFHQLTVDAYRLPNGQTMTEFENKLMNLNRPENFEKKVLLALLLDNDFDMSKIKQEAIKNESNSIFEGLERKTKKKQIPSSSNLKSFFS